MISDQEIEKVFCSINIEPKCLTIMALGDNGGNIDRTELWKKALDLVLEEDILPNSSTLKEYCMKFEDLGIVSENGLGYTLNDLGRRIVYPIAEFSLFHTVYRGWSLSKFLGRIGSGESKGPVNAIKMFEEIIKKGPVRRTDLEEVINGPARNFLNRVKDIETIDGDNVSLVKYESRTNHADLLEYRWVHKGRVKIDYSNPAYKQRKPIVERVIIELRRSRKYMSTEDVAKITGYHKGRIRDILHQLEEDSYVKEKSKWKMTKVQSRVETTKDGREFYRGFLNPTLLFVDGEIDSPKIREMQDKLGLNNVSEKWVFNQAMKIYHGRNGQD